MQKTVWFYVLAAAVAAAGGWYYFSHQQTVIQNIEIQSPEPSSTSPAPSPATDDELNRRRQEGIGSIRDLKPVPLDSSGPSTNGK